MWQFTKNIADFANKATNNINTLLDKLAGDEDENIDNNNNNNNQNIPKHYQITKELIEFINNLCVNHPHTFVLLNIPEEGNDLNEFQINHATLILKQCPNLEHVRYKLCPKYTTEKAFWSIYFYILEQFNSNDKNKFVPPSPKPIRRRRHGEISNRIHVREEYCNANQVPVMGVVPSDSESIASDWRQEEPLSPTLSSQFVVVGEEKLSTKTENSSAAITPTGVISPVASPKILTDDDEELP